MTHRRVRTDTARLAVAPKGMATRVLIVVCSCGWSGEPHVWAWHVNAMARA